MGDLSEHFSTRELACPHCGQCKVVPDLIRGLESLRLTMGQELVITSGYRCAEHNTAIKGTPASQHVLGTAADVELGSFTRFELYLLADQVPEFLAGGIGLYLDADIIHVDARGARARWARVGGRYASITDAVLHRGQ